GSQSETVNISALKPGSYYLVVTGDGKALTTTFVKKL
ncbi:MAG: T9SS type A sorting domain-containing protein, partial [Bacteroidales bacterium]|nr:T9SS type A sorting domain-containing protein [Bacteroidales bacterium]